MLMFFFPLNFEISLRMLDALKGMTRYEGMIILAYLIQCNPTQMELCCSVPILGSIQHIVSFHSNVSIMILLM